MTTSFQNACAWSLNVAGAASYTVGQYNVLTHDASELQAIVGAIGMAMGFLGVGIGMGHLLVENKKHSHKGSWCVSERMPKNYSRNN